MQRAAGRAQRGAARGAARGPWRGHARAPGRDLARRAHRRGDRATAAARMPASRRARSTRVRTPCARRAVPPTPGCARPDLADKLVPGVPELVSWLAGRDDVRLSLVTGNYEPVARLKLARAGIGHDFPAGQGGFGTDSEDRAALPRIARKRAGHDGVAHPRPRTIVIGDTPRDIACARADELRCFAVTTGPSCGRGSDRRRRRGRRQRPAPGAHRGGPRRVALSAWAWGTGRASSGPRRGRA